MIPVRAVILSCAYWYQTLPSSSARDAWMVKQRRGAAGYSHYRFGSPRQTRSSPSIVIGRSGDPPGRRQMLNHGNKRDGAENSSRPKHFGGTAQAISVSEPRTGQHLGTSRLKGMNLVIHRRSWADSASKCKNQSTQRGPRVQSRSADTVRVGPVGGSRSRLRLHLLQPRTHGRPAITGSQEVVNCIPNLACSPFMGPGAIDPRCGAFRRDGPGLFPCSL